MKILQILPYYAPAWGFGGPPRVMFDYARFLVSRGHNVTVYTSDAFKKSQRIGKIKDVIEGVEIYYFKNISHYIAWNKKKFLPLGFHSYLKKTVNNYDIIHISAVRNFLNLIAYPIIKKNGVPYVIDAHGSLPVATKKLRYAAKIYDFMFTKPMLKNAAALFAQTEHEAELYEKLDGVKEKIKLVPLTIDISKYCRLPEKGIFKKKYNVKENEKLITFLGRISKDKGLDLLIDIFARVISEVKDAKLSIIGRDDGYLDQIIKITKSNGFEDKVIFPGAMYGSDKIAAYNDSEIFLYTPTYWEETSTASLEAMACGVPAIVTKQADIPWLEDYSAGYCIDSNNPEELVSRVIELISDKELRQKKSSNALRLVNEKFSMENRIDDVERFLRCNKTYEFSEENI